MISDIHNAKDPASLARIFHYQQSVRQEYSAQIKEQVEKWNEGRRMRINMDWLKSEIKHKNKNSN